ncbi:MAG: TetR family transcriptional regulator [Alphaproteobacteria bacterium]|nr:TetR family transcriptional regulator [Alphaproteobacteria bacterium]
MARRTKEEAAKTRSLILKTAEKQFYLRGVLQTSLQEIAVAAGVTRGAIYWHFRDKADLLWSLADDVFMPHEDLMDRLVACESDDPLALLYEHTIASVNAITNNPSRRRIFTILTQRCEYVEELGKLNRRNHAMRDRLLARLVALFDQIEKKGLLAPAWGPLTAAMALQNLIIGFINIDMEYPAPSRKRDKLRNDTLASLFQGFRR